MVATAPARVGRWLCFAGLWLMGRPRRYRLADCYDRAGRRHEIWVPAWDARDDAAFAAVRRAIADGRFRSPPPGWAVRPTEGERNRG